MNPVLTLRQRPGRAAHATSNNDCVRRVWCDYRILNSCSQRRNFRIRLGGFVRELDILQRLVVLLHL
jgi:hypothetical protein